MPCTRYLVGKQGTTLFHKFPPPKKVNILDLIYIDICTMNTNTNGSALF